MKILIEKILVQKKELITADDITDITLTQAEYYLDRGYNEFDIACKIKGERDALHMRVQRHDDGYGIVIRTEKEDIWEAVTPTEVYKLDDKLKKVM